MTPEDVESRLQALRPPTPPEQLRARCLSPHRRIVPPRTLAVVAALLVLALVAWLVRAPEPVGPPSTLVVTDVQKLPGVEAMTYDGVLQDKVDRLLRKNPGKAILVIRVKRLQDGAFMPVTHGFWLRVMLEPADEEPDPLKNPDGPRADVDLDGTMLFVTTPGRYRAAGYENAPDAELRKLRFVWDYRDVTLKAGDVLLLADAVFAPWMSWASPADGSEVSVKEDPKLSWVPFPLVRSVNVEVDRVTTAPDGIQSWTRLGYVSHQTTDGNAVSLSQVLKLGRKPAAPGETIALKLTGYDRDGKELTGTKNQLLLLLKE